MTVKLVADGLNIVVVWKHSLERPSAALLLHSLCNDIHVFFCENVSTRFLNVEYLPLFLLLYLVTLKNEITAVEQFEDISLFHELIRSLAVAKQARLLLFFHIFIDLAPVGHLHAY